MTPPYFIELTWRVKGQTKWTRPNNIGICSYGWLGGPIFDIHVCQILPHLRLTTTTTTAWWNLLEQPFTDSGQWVPHSLYKPCNYSLYIGIIIFPLIGNIQSTPGPQLTLRKQILKKKPIIISKLTCHWKWQLQYAIPLMLTVKFLI